jgi:5-formyltetrahydrofolate cyclo-ligase
LRAPAKRRKDKQIQARLEKFPPFKKSKDFFTYLSHRGEVSTDSLIQKYFGKKKIVVPKLGERGICLFELQHPEKFEKGRFGIREAKICLAKKARNEINLALIPGIAFDTRGHRIGFGGGYFDRLLKKLRCTIIGLAYEFQMIDKVPAHAYDVPVDFIITEKRIIQCQRFRSKIRRSTKSSRQK